MPTDPPPLLRFLRGPWLLALLFFSASLVLFTQNNRFSFDYHPDEDGKVFQILKRERNYHHPLLLLNATDLAVHLSGTATGSQAVVITGRWVSAAFAAGAVALLAVLGFYRGGWLAGAVLGTLAATHEALFKAAHYLKEDTALAFGVALFLLAADRFSRRPALGTLRFLAIASAVATSGKYLGVVTVLFALPLLWRTGEALGPKRWKQFFLVFLGAFLLINIPPTTHPSSPFKSIRREVNGATDGHRGITREVPHAKYVPEVAGDVPAPLLYLAGLYLLGLIATARRRTSAEWALALFPIIYFTILSFSPKTSGRYLLPVTILLCAMAGLALVDLARLFALRPGKLTSALGALVLLGGGAGLVHAQLPLLRTTMADFTHDDRIELAAWIRDNLPANALIVEDRRVNLGIPAPGEESGKPQVPQTVFSADYAADLGTLESMRTWGEVYLAVSRRAYDRFFSSSLKPQPEEKADFERRKAFYDELFKTGELVLERRSQGNIYLQPGLRLYRLLPAGAGKPATPAPEPAGGAENQP